MATRLAAIESRLACFEQEHLTSWRTRRPQHAALNDQAAQPAFNRRKVIVQRCSIKLTMLSIIA
jgi:hypothetical protein